MPDPRPIIKERRPDTVPADWLTRQQAQTKLKMTPYLLRQYVALLADHHKGGYVDLGPGKPAYLSPAFVQAVDTLHRSVESAQDVPGYANRGEAVAAIGCGQGDFFELVTDNPPNVAAGDMRLLRNRNSQIFPHYSRAYVERLRLAHATKMAMSGRAVREIDAAPSPVRSHGPAVNRPADILAQRAERAKIEPAPLVELTDPERTAALERVSRLLTQLQKRERIYRGDLSFENVVRQLSMALTELQRHTRIPSGLDRLCEKAEQYSGERE